MSSWALQTAIRDRLLGFTPLTSLLKAPYVYDFVPQPERPEDRAQFPYLTVGDDVSQDWSTDTTDGCEVEVTIHSWSRYRGRKELKRIQEQVYAALHNFPLLVADAKVILIQFVRAEAGPDVDVETQHGIQQFRILIDHDNVVNG